MADIALERTDILAIRYAATVAFPLNVLMVVVAKIAIMWTISSANSKASGTPAVSI